MTNFPLYDSLSKDLPTKDLTVKQKEEFVDSIQNMDQNGKNLVYTLIQFYFMENEDDSLVEDELPYDGIRENGERGLKNLTWVFTDFPTPLRHILYKFSRMHLQNLQEERDRSEKLQMNT